MFGKESIGPTDMIEPVATSGAPTTSAKDTAQAHSYPAIQRAKGRAMTVLEILKPADQGPIQVRDDRRKALTPHALRLNSDGVFELLETLGPRPTFTLLEMITQKVKPAGGAGIDNPSFRRVQRKSDLGCPCLNQSQRPKRLTFRPAKKHEVIGVPHHLDMVASHQMVKRIKIDVGEQRAYDRALRRTRLRSPALHPIHHPLTQERFHKNQDWVVRNLFPKMGHEKIMGNRIK